MRLALLIALLAPGLAQADEGELTLGLAAGAMFTDQLEPFGHGIMYLPRVSYSFADGVDLELELPMINGKTRYQQHDYTMLAPRVQFRGSFIPNTRLQPFGTLGTGVFVKSADSPEVQPHGFVQGDVDWMISLGPGVLYRITDSIMVRTDYQVLANFGTERFENHGDTFLNWAWSVGLGYSFGAKDADKDGISDSRDQCPNEPEDIDGFQDEDGCPDPDNDGDGILDVNDACPNEAEDLDGFEDEDGCPDPDNDGDGVLDMDDACPLDPGPESTMGCPDADGDGIADERDACPDIPGIAAFDGCPDTDEDGVPDADDECPEIAGLETAFGCPDADGDGIPDARDTCPDEASDDRADPTRWTGCAARVFLGTEKIYVTEPLVFPKGKATLAGDSKALLDEVAALLTSFSELRVEVGVHADSEADQALTKKRADTIALYLLDKGIDSGRLVSKGYGATKPIEGAESSERIDFRLLAPKAPAGAVE